MAGSPIKRVIGTLLFTIALIVFLGFFFIVWSDAQNIRDVPGTENVEDLGVVAAIVLAVIALLMLILLIVRRLDKKAQKAAEAEAYYIPEEDRIRMRQEKEGLFDASFQGTPGPAPTPPDVRVYHIPAVPVMAKAWGKKEPAQLGALYPFYFPRRVESGVYVNDYIDVDRKGNRIKLRTLLAGTEDFPEAGTVREEPEAPAPEPTPAPEPEPEPVRPAPRRRPAGEMPGDRFMEELEARRQELEAETPPPAENHAFYDYAGNVQAVEEVEGIDSTYAKRLRANGVRTTARLCYEDPMELSTRIDCPTRTVRRWQATAQLMKVGGIGPQFAETLARAGITGIQELKDRPADEIADQVNRYLDGQEDAGGRLSAKRVAGWQQKAQGMQRVRMKVPAE